jgi:molecular chaperone IbpA
MYEQPFDPQNPWSKTQKKKNPHGLDYYDQWKTPPKPATIDDLFPKMDRWAIGFEDVFSNLQALSKSVKQASYPPYNISKFGDDKFEIRIAVAGFKKEELKVTTHDRTLTVESDTAFKSGQTQQVRVGELLHQGIAERDFALNFALAEFVEVEAAECVDGILTIKLVTNIPEEKKPKVIDIK